MTGSMRHQPCQGLTVPMNDLKKSIVISLDGQDDALFPYLAYLLQDLWEIGSFPGTIIQVIKTHNLHHHGPFTVLDLGCGKGAVSISIAKELGWNIHGIDAMPEFIDEAQEFAKAHHVKHLCFFEVADIRQRVKTLKGYDFVILGSNCQHFSIGRKSKFFNRPSDIMR